MYNSPKTYSKTYLRSCKCNNKFIITTKKLIGFYKNGDDN